VSARPSSLAARLRGEEPLRLLFVKMPCPAEVELAAAAGFDAIIIDTEHGSSDGLEHHLRAADASGLPALVRVPTVDLAPILRALDAGASGIVVPHVSDANLAQAAVAAAHYPPRGHRGLALTTRAGRYGTATVAEHLARAGAETLVVVQIEDADALECATEILGVDGVDAVLIGATDLSVSLGHPGAPSHPKVAAAISDIEAAARIQHVPVASVVASPTEAQAAFDRGNQLAVFVSALLIRDAFRAAAGRGAGDDRPDSDPAPLVLLPGMLGTADLWQEVADALSDSMSVRCGRIDLDDSVEEMADSVLAAAPERFALAGHSLGAIVALAAVRRAPGRVSRLILLNASALPASAEQITGWERLERQAHDGDFTELAAEFARANLPAHRRGETELLARVEAMARACGPRALLRQLAAQRARPDARLGLAAVACPTLIISGSDDEICPPVLQDGLAEGISGARLERLDGVGHMSPLEAPERVAALLAGWL
jgi:4-hydroxy-2-oxoheptanedioate aldolase